ncbi:uncharacterized protein CLUP02_04819 [Colletotrichum lupini]|uniref:Uncharacterized protein n=1 Tax=Colletotrichum lupini TaxID=145971 RepID=A0A9Q8WE51_9PEZI|nr:uncharacterized protein CLUP02_04819 [Colletotrichum lupini]UQC79340.1 hypothetical protein CLUP02_04819 [Colletotrichum lupini]
MWNAIIARKGAGNKIADSIVSIKLRCFVKGSRRVWDPRSGGVPVAPAILEMWSPVVIRGAVSAGPKQGPRHWFADSVGQEQIRYQSGHPISCTSEEGLLIILAKSQPLHSRWFGWFKQLLACWDSDCPSHGTSKGDVGDLEGQGRAPRVHAAQRLDVHTATATATKGRGKCQYQSLGRHLDGPLSLAASRNAGTCRTLHDAIRPADDPLSACFLFYSDSVTLLHLHLSFLCCVQTSRHQFHSSEKRPRPTHPSSDPRF